MIFIIYIIQFALKKSNNLYARVLVSSISVSKYFEIIYSPP